MPAPKLDLSDGSVRIVDLEICNKDVADYLREMPQDERPIGLIRAIETGVYCIERARTGEKLDFVRQQIQGLLDRVERAVDKIPVETQRQLADKIGTGEGQVLAPVQSLVQEISRATHAKINEVRDLLGKDIDPGKESSTLGRALKSIRDMLDPKRIDSIQGSLEGAIKQVSGADGLLAKAVKAVVNEAVGSLEDRLNDLAKEIRGREAAEEALQQTTLKGVSYEEEVIFALQAWAQRTGAEVNYVGTDNRPGDVLIDIDESIYGGGRLCLVVEARDRQKPFGRLAVTDALDAAMSERSANAAIYISKTSGGLARELGEWSEGTSKGGRWVACTHEHLITAVRFLVVQERLQAARASAVRIDPSSIAGHVLRIRTALTHIKTINTKATEIRNCADDVSREAEAIREEIRGALSELEESLRPLASSRHQQNAA